MQHALTVKGEEARWIKKGGQRDIKGNGGGGRKDSFTAQLHHFLCTFSKKPQIRQGFIYSFTVLFETVESFIGHGDCVLQVSGPLSVMEDKVNIYFYSLLLPPHLPLQIYCLKIQTLCAFLPLRPLLSLSSLYFLSYTLLLLCELEVVA